MDAQNIRRRQRLELDGVHTFVAIVDNTLQNAEATLSRYIYNNSVDERHSVVQRVALGVHSCYIHLRMPSNEIRGQVDHQ